MDQEPEAPEEGKFFPIEDALACLRDDILQGKNQLPIDPEFESELATILQAAIKDGAPESVVWTYFRSPEWTWEKLCGREGWLLVDPATGDQFDFFMTVMN